MIPDESKLLDQQLGGMLLWIWMITAVSASKDLMLRGADHERTGAGTAGDDTGARRTRGDECDARAALPTSLRALIHRGHGPSKALFEAL